MATRTVIHHPELKRQTKVGPGFAKALIKDGGWKAGPLPDDEPSDDADDTPDIPPRTFGV